MRVSFSMKHLTETYALVNYVCDLQLLGCDIVIVQVQTEWRQNCGQEIVISGRGCICYHCIS